MAQLLLLILNQGRLLFPLLFTFLRGKDTNYNGID
jgi:hypothetical protein